MGLAYCSGGETRNTKYLLENRTERDNFARLLKDNIKTGFEKQIVKTLTSWSWLRIRFHWLAFIVMAMHNTIHFPEQTNNHRRFGEHSTGLPCRGPISLDIPHKLRNNFKTYSKNSKN
jgi:hypothetical protein